MRTNTDNVHKLLVATHRPITGNLLPIVEAMHAKRTAILALAQQHRTPFYVIDTEALKQSIADFHTAFAKSIPNMQTFYAVKSNHHPYLLQHVVRAGFGLDVSSGRELALALPHKPSRILFSGPGKTTAELALALAHHTRVTVHMDSFGELRRLGALAKKHKKIIRAGIRIFTHFHDPVKKFGIPIEDLHRFFITAKRYPSIQLEGIQSHLSWSHAPEKYAGVVALIRKEIGTWKPALRSSIQVIDLGGGFYPNRTEGYYPGRGHYPWMMSKENLIWMADVAYGTATRFPHKYYLTAMPSLASYAKTIAHALKKNIAPLLPDCAYFFEPGRIICSSAMHIVLRIVDVKKFRQAITDGGINMTGWEFGQHFYTPLVNCTHPARKEIPYTIHGSLCTPRDVWGRYVYATRLAEGDVIVAPHQGAYRYALQQEFIKPIPPVYLLKAP
ncbi:alanine racemase [Candidatus Uhrbacteria bacterium]|nr:alanine racemase [Candidatus Uhrbacteria bacterium]